MKQVKIAGHDVTMYDSIESLPILRFHKYNKLLLIDAGIGSDLSDFDRHIEKVVLQMKSAPEQAATELENLRQNVYFIHSGVNPRHLAFAALVKEIDGQPYDDLSDSGLQRVTELLKDATTKETTDILSAVKKKIDAELRLYFPHLFDDADTKEYYDVLRRRTLLVLDQIITGEDKGNEIEQITKEMILHVRPVKFAGGEFEVRYDKQFEKMCLMLAQHANIDARKYSVLSFYNAFEYMKEDIRRQKDAYKARK